MKKHSDAKLSEEWHEPIHLLLDETIAGKLIVSGLMEHDIPAIPLDNIMSRGASDVEVLSVLANRPDLYLLTRDKDFRYHSAIRRRLIEAGVGVFVITSAGNKTGAQIVGLIVSAWNRILKFARKNKRPFIAKITGEGKVEEHQ